MRTIGALSIHNQLKKNQNNHLKAHSVDVDVISFVMEESINPLEINRSIITSPEASVDILEGNLNSITTDSSNPTLPLRVCSSKAGQDYASSSEDKKILQLAIVQSLSIN